MTWASGPWTRWRRGARGRPPWARTIDHQKLPPLVVGFIDHSLSARAHANIAKQKAARLAAATTDTITGE